MTQTCPFELPIRTQTGCEAQSQLAVKNVQELMKMY